MANYYCNIDTISRGKGESVAQRVNYITGKKIHDRYNGKTYARPRKDIVWDMVYVPPNGPGEYASPQSLVDALNAAEKRSDSRVARYIKGSLPNELPLSELIKVTDEFVRKIIVARGLCAVVAIHKGEKRDDSARNNPHCHIIFSTREVDADGLSKTKAIELDSKVFLRECRKAWAEEQNQAYKRYGLKTRVDHRSLREQGINRKPKNHLSREEWWLEQRGVRTRGGNIRRDIDAWNAAHQQPPLENKKRQKKKKLEMDMLR